MMRLKQVVLPVILLAALLCPAAGLCEEWPEFSQDYYQQVIALLQRLPSTRAHAAFVLDSRIPLEVTDNPTHVDDNTQAAYDLGDRRIYVDEVRLMEGAEELIDQGAPRDKVAEILAWKTLPTIVHELTHAVNHREIERLVGGFIVPCLESEKLSFYDELVVQHQLYRERPKLWAPDKILKIERSYGEVLLAWQKSIKDLDAYLRRLYDDVPELMAAPKAELLDGVERRIQGVTATLNELRELERRASQPGDIRRDELVRRDFHEIVKLRRYGESVLAALESTRQVLDDEASLRKVFDCYRSALAQRRRRLEALRGELR